MKIELQKLSLTNFKGIRSFSATFDHRQDIFGENATGKTTLKDAFLWLFFGKDSTDRKDFEIKTLQENNQPLHRLDHEVEATILVDGEEHILRRCLREKWVKKRGEQEAVFQGHETSFFWNDVPMKESEFSAKVASVFNETIFKLITNTDYFNGLKWQDRRAVLLEIAGKINDMDVLDRIQKDISSGHYEQIMRAIQQKKSGDNFAELRAELKAKKKKIKDELEQLPARIDEANRSMPEPQDYEAIADALIITNNSLDEIDQLLSSKSKAQQKLEDERLAITKDIGLLKLKAEKIAIAVAGEISKESNERRAQIAELTNTLRLKREERARLLNEHKTESQRLERMKADKSELVKRWEAVNGEELHFDDNDFHCPACKRAFEAGDIESKKKEMARNFHEDKVKKLEAIVERGKGIANEIASLELQLTNILNNGSALKAVVDQMEENLLRLTEEQRIAAESENDVFSATLETKPDYIAIKVLIEEKTESLNKEIVPEDNSGLVARKKELRSEIDQLKQRLAGKDIRYKIMGRIDDLKNQEAGMGHELAQLEGVEFAIEKFVKSKMDILESRINDRFEMVTFKMFEQQINGGQTEACTTLINGVPYADANNAAKIQAGLDIINTLSDHYGLYGPVWVDNRESVTRLPETKSQLINLIVSPAHKKLTVAKAEAAATA